MRIVVALAAAIAAALPACAHGQTAGRPDCSTILPAPRLPAGQRALTPEDLARLRDIGPTDPQYFADPFFTV